MSPRYFSKLMKGSYTSQREKEVEKKVEDTIKAVVAIIATPFKKIIEKDK